MIPASASERSHKRSKRENDVGRYSRERLSSGENVIHAVPGVRSSDSIRMEAAAVSHEIVIDAGICGVVSPCGRIGHIGQYSQKSFHLSLPS